MNVERASLPGVLLITPRVWEDPRGFFLETYNRETFLAAGIDTVFVQDNHSRSCRDTVRGLHWQAAPHPQVKLVRVVAGTIYDVVVDLRPASPSFRRWTAVTLSAESHRMLYVPEGCAHGFCVVSDSADVLYKCSAVYHPECERALRWDDPDIGVEWPARTPLLSERDRRARSFADLRGELSG